MVFFLRILKIFMQFKSECMAHFILKKKNKNVAADDVAGFVQIIDEGAAAPVAPVDPATGAPEMYAPQNNDNQNF